MKNKDLKDFFNPPRCVFCHEPVLYYTETKFFHDAMAHRVCYECHAIAAYLEGAWEKT